MRAPYYAAFRRGAKAALAPAPPARRKHKTIQFRTGSPADSSVSTHLLSSAPPSVFTVSTSVDSASRPSISRVLQYTVECYCTCLQAKATCETHVALSSRPPRSSCTTQPTRQCPGPLCRPRRQRVRRRRCSEHDGCGLGELRRHAAEAALRLG